MSLNLEEEMLKIIAGREHLIEEINLPPTNDFVINSRQERLHVRLYDDMAAQPIALIVYLHGMNAHINRPMYNLYAREYNRRGIAFAVFDFHSHGYSDDRTKKCYIQSYEHLIDDVWSVLLGLYSPHILKEGSYNLPRRYACPLFLVGQSMGGAVNIELSQEMMNRKNTEMYNQVMNVITNVSDLSTLKDFDECKCFISSFYRGSVLQCPAISASLPPPIVRNILLYIICPLFPERSIPEILQSTDNMLRTFKHESMAKYFMNDRYPLNQMGLSSSDGLRFRTAASILGLMENIQEKMHSMAFPFLAFHDPKDGIVPIKGVEDLMAKTEAIDKELVLIEDGRHDLFTNAASLLVEKIISWIIARADSPP